MWTEWGRIWKRENIKSNHVYSFVIEFSHFPVSWQNTGNWDFTKCECTKNLEIISLEAPSVPIAFFLMYGIYYFYIPTTYFGPNGQSSSAIFILVNSYGAINATTDLLFLFKLTIVCIYIYIYISCGDFFTAVCMYVLLIIFLKVVSILSYYIKI
jgi:hypothetical protein